MVNETPYWWENKSEEEIRNTEVVLLDYSDTNLPWINEHISWLPGMAKSANIRTHISFISPLTLRLVQLECDKNGYFYDINWLIPMCMKSQFDANMDEIDDTGEFDSFIADYI